MTKGLLASTARIWDRNVKAARKVYLDALHALAANECPETRRSVIEARSALIAAVAAMEADQRAAEAASQSLNRPRRRA